MSLPVNGEIPVKSRRRAGRLLILMPLLFLAACAGRSALERGQHMDNLATTGHWHKLRLPVTPFVLTAYVPNTPMPPATNKVLTVYIEGDGLAWRTRSRASDNPTPGKPIGLEMAMRHPAGAVAYLARPCQNVAEPDWPGCQQSYWTDRRYSTEVVRASSEALTMLKARYGAERLILVGYSGGAAVAALVAARRQDVARVVTVAGNLDIHAWTTRHRIQPLSGSLNPADEWDRLQGISQLHFVGGKDPVISPELVSAYIRRFPAGSRPRMRILPDFDHACCWVEQWPELSQEAVSLPGSGDPAR